MTWSLTRLPSQLTRGLRARLAYASFKATNNVSNVPLPDLEHRIGETTPPLPSSPFRAPAPPRSPFTSPHKRRVNMPPPASPSYSLYSSLLGPPPTKRPRHAHSLLSSTGPGPSPSDLLPSYSPGTPRSKGRASPQGTPHGLSPFPSGGQGRTVRTVMEGRARSTMTEKEDINAAATLTALMFNRGSPRQRAEDSSTRTTTPVPSHENKPTEDADAAELMLYLATSPSPARPTVVRRAPPTTVGRILFPSASVTNHGEDQVGRPVTPGLTASQSSSQDTAVSQLLPPPPSPSRAHARSPASEGSNARKSTPFDVSRKLFSDGDDTRRISDRDGARFSLGKGIDLVEAQ